MRMTHATVLIALVAIVAILAGADPALAQAGMGPGGPGGGRSLGTMADSLKVQTTNLVTFVTVLSFLIGAGMAIAGFLKFYAHSKNPNDPSAKVSTAFVFLLVGSGLVALPATLGSGIQTIFGSNATTTDGTSGFRVLR